MNILSILQFLALTMVTGLVSLLRPRSVLGFTGLSVPGPRGISEIRSVLGGVTRQANARTGSACWSKLFSA